MNPDQTLVDHIGPRREGYIRSSTFCNIDFRAAGKSASAPPVYRKAAFGALDIWRRDGFGFQGGRRDFIAIREDNIDNILIGIPLSDPAAISQSGRSFVAEPGSCFMLATINPFEFRNFCGTAGTYSYSELVVQVPGSLLRQHVPNIEDCCAKPVTTQRGAGKLLRSMTEMLFEDRNDYSDAQARHFGTLLLDAIANVILETPELIEPQSPRRQTAHMRVYERAGDFIDSNLSNPNLSLKLIADHCRVSVSYLGAAFAAHSMTVGEFIREKRLQRCREALQSSFLRHQSIIEIAMRWGFETSSGFNRAYRARFGKAPSEDRILGM